MDSSKILEAFRDFMPVLAALLAAGAAAFGICAVMAFTHVKARLILDFYKELGTKIEKDQATQKAGTEVPHLGKYQELHVLLRDTLEKERILRRPVPKK